MVLERVAGQTAFLRAAGHPDTIGVLFKGSETASGANGYVVIGKLPAGTEKIWIATMANRQVVVAQARKAGDLPNGLSAYSFVSRSHLPCVSSDARATGPFFVCRIEATEALDAQERDSLNTEIQALRAKQEELTDSQRRNEQERFRPAPPDHPGRRAWPQHMMEESRERQNLILEIAKLTERLEMPVIAVSATETARGGTKEEIEKQTEIAEGSLLVSADGAVVGFRHGNEWLDIKGLRPPSPEMPSAVKLQIRGTESNISLSFEMEWDFAIDLADCSVIAATTYELESIPGADIADRLSKIGKQPVNKSGPKHQGSKSLKWNGKPTTLWVKIFRNDRPESPIIDEMILLDYSDGLSARWGKPPSALVASGSSRPDAPPDLIKERKILEPGGTILDMVAAGDGSVLLIGIDQAPYWRALDLKTLDLQPTPWQANKETLLATQAGKVYLIDRKTKIVEIWDLDARQRVNRQILDVEGDIVAVAAPLSSPDSPILITSEKCVRFVDPVKFEQMAQGPHLDARLDTGAGGSDNRRRLDPLSLRARASGDGTIYLIVGHAPGSGDNTHTDVICLWMDKSFVPTISSSSGRFLSVRGRRSSEGFLDHGGTNLSLRATRSGDPFPCPPGVIRFTESGQGNTVAEFKGAPFLPSENRKKGSRLAPDRGLYLDSSLGILLIPESSELHAFRLNLPPMPQAPPEFVLAGEEITLPLPPGRDHKVVLDPEAESTIDGNVMRWKVPSGGDQRQITANLEWVGELGTALKEVVRYRSHLGTPKLIAQSPDGKTTFDIPICGVVPSNNMMGFAGAGNVVITGGSDITAWSLENCRPLFVIKEDHAKVLGDADSLYLLTRDSEIKSYDLRTGKLRARAQIGNASRQNGGIDELRTGISSRLPVVAIEREGTKSFLSFIDRATLRPTLLDIRPELQQSLFLQKFTSNPSGSVLWSNQVAIFQDAKSITVESTGPNSILHGTPDHTGRFIVGMDKILDLKTGVVATSKPANLRPSDTVQPLQLDASCRYLLNTIVDSAARERVISISMPEDPARELLKIIAPGHAPQPVILSGTNKLLLGSPSASPWTGVYHLDIPELARRFGSLPATP